MNCHELQRKSRNDSPKSAPKLAIVVPCYNEEAVVAHTYNALCQKLDSLIAQNLIAKESFLCFVDDGSKDKTCELLLALKNHHTDKFCHTELSQESEVSQNNSDKDISAFSKPQYDKNLACHTELSQESEVSIKSKRGYFAKAQYDNIDLSPFSKAQNDNANKSAHDDKNSKACGSKHKLIKLTRNYGHQNALLAGLHFVKDKCDCVVSMDCDLQDDINALDEMLAKFKSGADIVYGVRKARDKDTAFKKYTALGFYKFMQTMGVTILYNHADYRLLSHRACENLLEFKEVNLFLRGIVPLVGYKSEVVYYERGARFAGESKYPFAKMLTFALNGITSFSIAPLRLMSVLGVVLFFASICYGIYALYMKFFTAEPISGWTSTILVLLFFGGMQFLGLGIMGEYIGKIYSEVKHRPRYFVEEVL